MCHSRFDYFNFQRWGERWPKHLEANHIIDYNLQDFFKSLTKLLQTIIMEIIDFNRSTCLTRKFILDYVLLLQETLEWLKKSKKNMICFSLISLNPMIWCHGPFFQCLQKVGICDDDQITICSCWGNYQLKWCTYTIFSHLSKGQARLFFHPYFFASWKNNESSNKSKSE